MSRERPGTVLGRTCLPISKVIIWGIRTCVKILKFWPQTIRQFINHIHCVNMLTVKPQIIRHVK